MEKIKLFADSTCDLSKDLLKKNDIGIVPLYVNFGLQTFKDNVEITPRELYARVAEKGVLPTTAAPTPDDFKAYFDRYVKQGQDVIYISISSKLSSSYQNAGLAAASYPEGKVKVIDSLNLSCGIGLLVLFAAECIRKGQDSTQTVAAVQAKIPRIESEFILDTVEYLHKGGRCSGLQMFLSSLLKIHPIIEVTDGSMHAAAKVRGGRRQVMEHLLKSTVDHLDEIEKGRLIVVHSECPEDATWLRDELKKLDRLGGIPINEASCVISSHCGPRTLGIMYIKK